MCGIAGFCDFTTDFLQEGREASEQLLRNMNLAQKHRGPDGEGSFLSAHCGLAHVRLAVLDPVGGGQPIFRQGARGRCCIVHNGEIYNMPTLKRALCLQGERFETGSDAEVILAGYLRNGISFLQELNGIFAFAIFEEAENRLFLVRDRLGVKPLFFSRQGDTLVFSSEIKGLLQYPGLRPEVDRDGLCALFGLGPAKAVGSGVFRQVEELPPATCLIATPDGIKQTRYWSLVSHPHTDTYAQTVERVRYLITDAVRLQLLSDVPICTFLSGGIDSSLVTAISAALLKKEGKQLDTFSFDFVDNHSHFTANAFQPSEDRPYVEIMSANCGSNHTFLECENSALFSYLFRAVAARDLPCMADVESSLLYFCERVAATHKVALTGECADEIFGGYPWFHKPEGLAADCFPWSCDFTIRSFFLKDELRAELPLEAYAKTAYRSSVAETPRLTGETGIEARRREIAYLNLRWFMQTLLDRMDRTSMHTGLEARVPFADHRIVEYLWNVPWEMKSKNGVVKGLLREAAKGLLPDEVLYRKKSPYPKTYDPAYETLVKQALTKLLQDGSAPLCRLVDAARLQHFFASPSDYGRPFYGQLMAGPQLLAYLLQVNDWLERYQVRICL